MHLTPPSLLAKAAVRSKEVVFVNSLFIVAQIHVLLCSVLFFAIILMGMRQLGSLTLFIFVLIVLCPFLEVWLVGLQCVIVFLTDHTHLTLYRVTQTICLLLQLSFKPFFQNC